MNGIKSTFEKLRKMDPSLARALANVRAGTATKQDADLLARGMYTDTLIPKMGNKLAYNDFLSRNENQGIHVNADLNDFGQINKLHGDAMGDAAIKRFGEIASETSRMFGGKSFRSGGDEFKFWFHRPEHAHGFARELRARIEREPKVGGTHNLAASVGIGYNRGHAENALLDAKKQLGTTNVFGHRDNFHTTGNAPSVVQSKLHEPMPPGWKPSKGLPEQQPKTTPNLAEPGLKFHNPLGKNEVHNPVPEHIHPVLSGRGSVGIMTAENPRFHSVEDGGNERLENELKNRGVKFEKITGKYDINNLEHSFLIHDLSEKDLIDLGGRYGQETVIHSKNGNHKMIHVNGPNVGNYHPGSGVNEFSTPPEMYYSTVIHNGRPIHFSMNFDFDKIVPHKEEMLSKAFSSKFPVEDVLREYSVSANIPYYKRPLLNLTDESKFTDFANAYLQSVHNPNDPNVKASYDALKRETLNQYNFLKSKGYRFTPVEGNATPFMFPERNQAFSSKLNPNFQYLDDAGNPMHKQSPYGGNFENLYNDFYGNKHLKVFTGGPPRPDHPLAEKLPFADPLETYNNVFRAVHDIFGHGLAVERFKFHHGSAGVDFGHHGEDHAYRTQAATFSPLARKALASETRGQNAAFHFGPLGPHNRNNPTKAQYPEQKATILPEEHIQHGIEHLK